MRRKLIIAFVVVATLAGAAYYWFNVYQSGNVLDTITGVFSPDNEIVAPTEDIQRKVSATISAEDGGKIRVIDAMGVVMTLTVPAGALAADTEITLTPFTESATNPISHGVAITPTEVTFAKPAALAYDWNMLTQIAGKKPDITKRPDVLTFNPESETITLTPISPATMAPNYVPATINATGWYGVTTDTETVLAAAKATLKNESNTLALLAASITLANVEANTSETTKQAEGLLEVVLNNQEPSLYELELAAILDEKLKKPITLIPKAQAYGLYDGYLQLRCNQDFTTYEEATIAAKTAQKMGYDDVAKTCIARAEKILMAMAEEVVADKTRPIMDVLEIYKQMELLGLITSGRGKVLAESMVHDFAATRNAIIKQLGGDDGDDEDGTARQPGRSRPPLTGNDTNLPNELFALQFLPLLGINAYDEASFKQFGDSGSAMMNNAVMASREMCPAIRQLAGEMGIPLPPEFEEECGKVESDKMLEGIEVWEQEVDEYAEGITDVQNNQAPNSNMMDMSELEAFSEWLEN